MTFAQLRLKHPRLVYRFFTVQNKNGEIVIEHEFLLEPDILFRPRTVIPYDGQIRPGELDLFAFHLGLAESVSYWKAACPAEFVVEAGVLSQEQIRFWKELYIHGLGEFFFQNRIDFTLPDFLSIQSAGSLVLPSSSPRLPEDHADLVLVGGGKDSAVTLGMLSQSHRTVRPMAVNPTQATRNIISVSGIPDPIYVQREIDPRLLSLNQEGYLNGHTPFSAYLAFLGSLVGYLCGTENVIVSNERSANEGNVMYRGMEINHQYSKSFRFEEAFRRYVSSFLPDAPSYFSLLRPLNDLQIGRLFTSMLQYFSVFLSCNAGSRTNAWCGKCAKCAFTYLSLSPFVPYNTMIEIFGRDYFAVPDILTHIEALTGLSGMKPLDCVGTQDESVLAVHLSVGRYVQDGREVPEGLLKIKSDLHIPEEKLQEMKRNILETWGDTYNLPEEHLAILRGAWDVVWKK